jgi:uncharacterized membrane protein YfcA
MEFLIPVFVPLNIVLSAYIVYRNWQYIEVQFLFRQVLPIVCFGAIIGLYIFNNFPNDRLKLIFGICVFLFSLYELIMMMRPEKVFSANPPPGKIQSFLWLFGGGVMQGMYASGGPMVVYLAGKKSLSKQAFRATLSTLWLIVNILLFSIHILYGKITVETLKIDALLLPSVFVGLYIGDKLHNNLVERHFRIAVYGLLVFAGAFLILNGI